MVFACSVIEVAATLVENLVVLLAVSSASGVKERGRGWWLRLAGLTVLMTLLVSGLNAVSLFSFLTIIVCMLFAAVSTRLLSSGTLLVRLTACLIVYFVFHSIDYISLFVFGLLVSPSSNAFDAFYLILEPGAVRIVYLLVMKLINIALFLLSRKALAAIRKLKDRYCLCLFAISTAAYFTMSYLLNSILQGVNYSPQMIAILWWLFILICLILVVVVFIIMDKYHTEKRGNEYLAQTNAMMAVNYREMHTQQQENAKLLHDFKHHLMVMQKLASEERAGEITEYIESLIKVTYQEAALCRSGNDIIDAIINYKAAEAKQDDIRFEFSAAFWKKTNIAATDLCGVLANQIENAMEACRKIPPGQDRTITVNISQTQNFAVFRVENTVSKDPFEDNPHLHSTKCTHDLPHGWGIKNIRDIAEKYDGSLRNVYKNGVFISVAALCFEPMDTEKSSV